MTAMTAKHPYEAELTHAKEHLARWEELGVQLQKTNDAGWQNMQRLRLEEIKMLELLIETTNTWPLT